MRPSPTSAGQDDLTMCSGCHYRRCLDTLLQVPIPKGLSLSRGEQLFDFRKHCQPNHGGSSWHPPRANRSPATNGSAHRSARAVLRCCTLCCHPEAAQSLLTPKASHLGLSLGPEFERYTPTPLIASKYCSASCRYQKKTRHCTGRKLCGL